MHRLLILLVLLIPLPTHAAELKIATWNLDWLTTRHTGDRGLPTDVTTRSDEDFARLAQYAQELNADLIAIQEVDGYPAASRVFPKEQYSIHMTRDHVVQRVGIVVRRGLHYDINPDVTALAEHHLKKGCRDLPLSKATSEPCQELRDQIEPLTDWIADRKAEAVPFIVLGDFNRWMDGPDTFLASLRQAAPLVRATEGHSSPCWGKENFIDHILAGGPAARWMQFDTLRVMTYRETERSWQDRLSDHCPVSVRLVVPE